MECCISQHAVTLRQQFTRKIITVIGHSHHQDSEQDMNFELQASSIKKMLIINYPEYLDKVYSISMPYVIVLVCFSSLNLTYETCHFVSSSQSSLNSILHIEYSLP